jgi:hypothetical protein
VGQGDEYMIWEKNITLVKISECRQIPWVFRFISEIFIFLHGNYLDFIPGQKFILENSRNSLKKQVHEKSRQHQKFHEFSGMENPPGIWKQKDPKFFTELGRFFSSKKEFNIKIKVS